MAGPEQQSRPLENLSLQDKVIQIAKNLENIKDPKLKEKFSKQYESLAKLLEGKQGEISEISKPLIEELHRDIEDAAFLEVKFSGLNEGYEEFISYLFTQNISTQERKDIIQVLKAKTEEVSEFFEDNGYLNSETIGLFKQKFFGENKLNAADVEKTILNNYQSIKKLRQNIDIDSLTKSPEGREFAQKLEELSETEITDINMLNKNLNKFLSYLNQDKGKFISILKTIKESDEKSGRKGKDSAFESLKTFAQENSPELFAQIIQFETTYKVSPQKLADVPARATLEGGNFREVGGKLEAVRQVEGKNEIVTYDPKTGERDLKLQESNYAIKTDIPNRDIQPQVIAFERVRMTEEPKIQKYEALLKFLSQTGLAEKLKDAQSKGESLTRVLSSVMGYSGYTQLKNELQSEGFDIESIQTASDFEELKTRIQTKKDASQKNLDAARKIYEQALQEYQVIYRLKLQEKDARIREVLAFFRSIGFDLIPKSITDSIIRELQSGGVLEGFGFTTKIDIKKGILGVDNGKTGLQDDEKTAFVKFFSKMLSGKVGEPLLYEGGKIKFTGDGKITQFNDRAAFGNYIKYKSGLYENGSFSRKKAIENVKAK